MKIYISYDSVAGPWGGSNQVLKFLFSSFKQNNSIVTKPDCADVILIDSYLNVTKNLKLRYKFKNKLFIHRIDGPICSYNTKLDFRDKLVYLANKYISDATIFQSGYSLKKNIDNGLNEPRFHTIINNSANPEYFFKNRCKKRNKKILIISTSWSKNINKGFNYYKWLDDNLDFNLFEYHFIGRSPYTFKNIKIIEPLCSRELGLYLQKFDLYITASSNDPCSNSLIEALSCGLPVVYLDSGGHSELVKNNGVAFNDYNNLLSAILECRNDYLDKKIKYLTNMPVEYINYFKYIMNKEKTIKCISFFNYFKLIMICYFYSFLNILINKIYFIIKK